MKKRHFRFCRTLVMLVLTVCLLAADLSPALAVTQAEINALKKDAAELDSRKKELEKQLDALSEDKAEVLQRRKLLDQQVANTSAQIQNIETQIAEYTALINQTAEELAQTEQQEAEQYELFCKRVRAMEEQGTVDYWSVLFRANSFGDLLSRLDAVNEIMEYDQRVIEQLKALQVEIAEKKASLEDSKAQTEAAKAELVSRKKELDAQRQEAINLIKEIQGNESKYQSTLKSLDAEEERIQANIVKLSKELAAQQAAQGKPVQSSSGGYIWPVDSRYITSTVGGRTSPGGVGSTNHKGTDIGRVGYTSPIYASKAGTVIVSQYSSSYGNYVVVSHGSGNTTLYAHMSSRKVEVGQYVNQGAVLGITGSTGNSTGPHLHFEITENGVRINPLSHGAQPQKGYLSGYSLSGTGISK
jgi:murein DD-endopeptidase MepM/ murein hydrolase activator NlpD